MGTGTRDDFSQKIKNALALRASYLCSFPGCEQSTVGPSDEAPDAHACVGEAAHITAAAPGPGARRYDPSLTKDERTSIDNAIWLCATHARLIDRDEVTYSVDEIRRWKREHEQGRNAALRGAMGSNAPQVGFLGRDLIGLGPDVIAVGIMNGTQGSRWRLEINHFVSGSVAHLIAFGEEFRSRPEYERYVVLNTLGDGRSLALEPAWDGTNGRVAIELDVRARFPRTRAQDLGPSLKFENGDLSPRGGTVAGLERWPQHLEFILGLGRGEFLFSDGFGSRLAEYHALYGGTPWFERLVKLEVIRLASIPYLDEFTQVQTTPLACVDRVLTVTTASALEADRRLPITVVLDVHGVGRWTKDIRVCVPEYPPVAQVPPSRSAIGPRRS